MSLFCGDSTLWSHPFWRFLRAQCWKPSLRNIYCFLFCLYICYDCVNLYEPQYKETFFSSFCGSVLRIHLYNLSFNENKLSTIWAKYFSSTQGWLLVLFGRMPLYSFLFQTQCETFNFNIVYKYDGYKAYTVTNSCSSPCTSVYIRRWQEVTLNSFQLKYYQALCVCLLEREERFIWASILT